MKRAALSFALVLSVQLGVPGFAKADNSENVSLSVEGDMDNMDTNNGDAPFWGESGHGGDGRHGGGGCHGGGRRDGYWGGGGGWDGGRGGYGGSSWTCMAENSYRNAYYGTGYSQYDAQREALRSCNSASFFSNCYVTRCY